MQTADAARIIQLQLIADGITLGVRKPTCPNGEFSDAFAISRDDNRQTPEEQPDTQDTQSGQDTPADKIPEAARQGITGEDICPGLIR